MAKYPVEVKKLLTAIEDQLGSQTMQTAWGVVETEYRNKTLIFRLPEKIQLYDELWEVIQAVETRVKIQRRGKWPTAAEIGDILGDIRWLWLRWIPRGFLTLLVGEPGTGKSIFALDFVGHVVQGTAWPLEPSGNKPALASWVETESSQQLLNLRAVSMGIPRERIILPGFGGDLLGQPDLMSQTDRDRMVALIKYNMPAMVVIDSLGGAHTRGENKVEEVRPMLDFLARLARDEDIAILAVHHLRKRSAGEDIETTLDRVRGSSAFSAFARSVLAVEPQPDNSIKLRVIKANLVRKAHPIQALIHSDASDNPTGLEYVEFVPPPAKKTKKERCADWLYTLLSEAGAPVPVGQIIAMAEGQFTRQTIYDCREIIGNLEVTSIGREALWAVPKSPVQ